ncbi:MAG: hypothetical protein HYU55_01755 [Nocardioides sp.]|nr:hypothetical protein [Nocardioides sp.]
MQFPWQSRPRAPRPQVDPIRLDPAADVASQRAVVARLSTEQITAAWYLPGDALVAARDPRRSAQLVVLQLTEAEPRPVPAGRQRTQVR